MLQSPVRQLKLFNIHVFMRQTNSILISNASFLQQTPEFQSKSWWGCMGTVTWKRCNTHEMINSETIWKITAMLRRSRANQLEKTHWLLLQGCPISKKLVHSWIFQVIFISIAQSYVKKYSVVVQIPKEWIWELKPDLLQWLWRFQSIRLSECTIANCKDDKKWRFGRLRVFSGK